MFKWISNFRLRWKEASEERYCFDCTECGEHCRIKETSVLFFGEQTGLYHANCSNCGQDYVFNANLRFTQRSMTKIHLGPIVKVSGIKTGESLVDYAKRACIEYKEELERERRRHLKHEIVPFRQKGGRQ